MFGFFKKKKDFQENTNLKKSKYNFLVIDDDQDILDIYQDEFEDRYQAKVNRCTGIECALTQIQSMPFLPDLIICDINMPGEKNGLHLQKQLREEGIQVPIIYISGLPGEEVDDGEYVVLSKPINMKKLDKLVKEKLAS